MKRSGFLIFDVIFSFMKKLYDSLPSFFEIKSFVLNSFVICKEEFFSLRYKSKNLLNVNLELGLYHLFNGNVEDAKLRFQLIKIVCPNLSVVHYNLGRCYLVLQRTEKAISSFTKALEIDSNFESATYYLNKIQSPEKVREIPKNVVKQYFNYVSGYFIDYWLVAKQYRGHQYIRSVIINFYTNDFSQATILDLGCGTGICGQFLKNNDIGKFIVGVDISNNMLNISCKCSVNNKRVYDELVNEDIFSFLESNQEKKYDIILLAEVLHYIGDLSIVFQLSQKILNDDGLIIVLVRRQSYRNKMPFSFVAEGDFFCYSEDYISSIAEENGIAIVHSRHCKIYGNQIEGLLFGMQKVLTKNL